MPDFLASPGEEAEKVDPQQRLLLEESDGKPLKEPALIRCL